MKHRGQPEAVHTAMDSKDLLSSKWSLYISRCCQKPYGPLAFTIQRNAPGLVLKWHDKAHLTATVKGTSTVGAELLCGALLMPLEQETNTSASPFGDLGLVGIWQGCMTRETVLRHLVSSPGFSLHRDGCFFLDIFWCHNGVVCELHTGSGVGRQQGTERDKEIEREGEKPPQL